MDDAMDVDMFLPQPEELEWLEANSHLQEEDYFDEPPYPEDEEDEPPPPQPPPPPPPPQPLTKSIHSIPSKPTISPCPKPPPVTGPQSISKAQINNSQKRSQSDCADDLFPGQLGTKRSRTDCVGAENDEDWLLYTPPSETDRTHDVVDLVGFPKEKLVSRFASEIDGDCIPVTGLNGDRVYAKINRVERKDKLKNLDIQAQSTGGLILEPINNLLQKVEQEAFTKALNASSEGQNDEILPQTSVVKEQLWVDKYSPNSFTELLSDEQTNREVLLWLKQWDSCVFGSEIRTTGDEVLSALRRHSSLHQKPSARSFFRKNGLSKISKYDFAYSTNVNQESVDAKGIQESWNKKSRLTGPPEQKIILLCGPPGLGKTTLAHVAAKHCGYRVVEINASDDRSSSTIEAKIQDAVQMNSVMVDSKPKCLVIDEIDGALGDGKGAVEVILKMVSTDRKSDNRSENGAEGQSGRAPSKKKHKKASLSRPVICICNDLYAPALRQLRQIAKVHTFVQPTVSRVVSRLKYICNKEGLRTSSIALTALAEYTRCDIRSCLNTLQFLHKKKETLNVLEISSQVVGQKDISRSIIDIWKEIFQKRRMIREKNSDNSCSRMSNEFNSLYSLISSRGDYDLIFDGIHENILHLNYHDPVMQKTVKCINSLGVSDLIHQYVMHTQKLPLYVYQPPIAITAHRVIAQVERPNIEWPKSFHRYRTMLTEKKEIFRSWHYKIWPYISRHLSAKSFVEDSISPLLHILSPPSLRPVALHLLSENAKNNLAELVGTMVSYSVTYKNVKPAPQMGITIMTHDGALDASLLSFDPLISDFISFKGHKSVHYLLSLAVKQILVHEVEKQKILQVSIGKYVHLTDECSKDNQALTLEENNRAKSDKTDYAAVCFEKKMEVANGKVSTRLLNPSTSNISSTSDSGRGATAYMKLKSPGDIKKPSSGTYNFFDRFIKLNGKGSHKSDKVVQKEATLERDSRPLLFKFNEGYTNAVKRPVRIREFLLR